MRNISHKRKVVRKDENKNKIKHDTLLFCLY